MRGELTWKKENGEWGIKGVDLAALPPAVYGALCKLRDMEHPSVRETSFRGSSEERSEPLTLRELRCLDGEPVWCMSPHDPGGHWYLVRAAAKADHEFIAVGVERGIPCAGIESGFWLAYRRHPEGGGGNG